LREKARPVYRPGGRTASFTFQLQQGQLHGLRGTSYAKDSPRASPFVAWGEKTLLYFELLDATSQGTTGNLMQVMQAAERIGCDFVGVYSADVLKGTVGRQNYDPEYDKALKYGAEALGKR